MTYRQTTPGTAPIVTPLYFKVRERIDGYLVSRSEAKGLLAAFEPFKQVVLDFSGVDSIGPSFADEIFRLYARQHPEIELLPVNANEDVTRMIRRAQAALKAEGDRPPSPPRR